jgi:hypothetical protein
MMMVMMMMMMHLHFSTTRCWARAMDRHRKNKGRAIVVRSVTSELFRLYAAIYYCEVQYFRELWILRVSRKKV